MISAGAPLQTSLRGAYSASQTFNWILWVLLLREKRGKRRARVRIKRKGKEREKKGKGRKEKGKEREKETRRPIHIFGYTVRH